MVVQPKGKRSTYTVQPGDTLAVIAMKNGVNWRDVAKWNQIDPEKTLFVGTSLYLYDAKPQEVETTAKSAAKPDVYVVQANDSLTGVANQFNLSVKQLAEYNDLSVTDDLFVGQKLQLKNLKVIVLLKEPKAIQASTRRIATKSYTVKRGEYLKLIADRYALSNQELADLTPGLSAGSNLIVGQKLMYLQKKSLLMKLMTARLLVNMKSLQQVHHIKLKVIKCSVAIHYQALRPSLKLA